MPVRASTCAARTRRKRSRKNCSVTLTCSWWLKPDGKIIGSVIGGFDGRRGMIYHLAVEEAYRQQGVGAALMDELEAPPAGQRLPALLPAGHQDNEAAIRFYEASGWERMDLHILRKGPGCLMRIAILTVSDRSCARRTPDPSGPALAQAVTAHGWQVVQQADPAG